MNCKPGDLAVVVNDIEWPENNGALVKVLRTANPSDYTISGHSWECEAVSAVRMSFFVFNPGASDFAYRDCELRPIRDNDGEDEMLRIAGKPNVTDLRPKETA